MRSKPNSKYINLLLVEDDTALSQVLTKRFNAAGFQTTARHDGKAGLSEAISKKYSLIIADIGLPELSGIDLIKRVREAEINTPIIAITNHQERNIEHQTFANGVNIFHQKPIDFELLELQINSLLRSQLVPEVIDCGDLHIELHNHRVTRGEKEIDLSKRELQLLTLLIVNKDHVLSRAEIINRLSTGRGNLHAVEEGSIDTLISRIRNKLGTYKGVDIIVTTHGVGYGINLDFIKSTPSA